MNNNIKNLKLLFDDISSKGWIKSVSKGYGGGGETFEYLIGNERNNFELPDYRGIEIKTKKVFSKSYIKLFNSTPDGKYLFEIKRIRDKYGYPSDKIKNSKIFNVSIRGNRAISIGKNYSFKLKVNESEEKIYLNVYDVKNNLIDSETYWSFDILEEKLLRKLKVLAVVDVLVKRENGFEYYKYSDINFYQLRDFQSFVELIDKGIVVVTFNISVFLTGKRTGETHDHGTSFRIREEDLYKLYDKINI